MASKTVSEKSLLAQSTTGMKGLGLEKIERILSDLTIEQRAQLKYLWAKAQEGVVIQKSLLIDKFGVTSEEATAVFNAFTSIARVAGEEISQDEYSKLQNQEEVLHPYLKSVNRLYLTLNGLISFGVVVQAVKQTASRSELLIGAFVLYVVLFVVYRLVITFYKWKYKIDEHTSDKELVQQAKAAEREETRRQLASKQRIMRMLKMGGILFVIISVLILIFS